MRRQSTISSPSTRAAEIPPSFNSCESSTGCQSSIRTGSLIMIASLCNTWVIRVNTRFQLQDSKAYTSACLLSKTSWNETALRLPLAAPFNATVRLLQLRRCLTPRQYFASGLGNQDRFARASAILAQDSQSERQVEGHAGLQRGMIVQLDEEMDRFQPVRREADSDRIAEIVVELDAILNGLDRLLVRGRRNIRGRDADPRGFDDSLNGQLGRVQSAPDVQAGSGPQRWYA